MKILALDTTAKTAGIALLEATDAGLSLLGEYDLKTGTHSTTLLPMIESVLALCGLTTADIDLYAVSTGPGSFTGVRIGVSTVKGLAFLHGTPCIGVSALEAMAMGFDSVAGIILPAMDARRGTVYGAAFRADGEGHITRLSDDAQLAWDEFTELARAAAEEEPEMSFYACGDAYAIPREDTLGAIPAPKLLDHPTGYGVGAAAYRIWQTTDDRSVFTDGALVPVYLKKSQAEREREEAIAAKQEQ